MDYEKEYKSLVGKIKNAYLFAQTNSTKSVLEECLPELKESENERISKVIIKIISDIDGGFPFEKHGITKRDAIAWLEKRSEQNPAWSEEDKKKLNGICMYIMCSNPPEGYTEWIDFLKSIKDRVQPQPKQEWSEEDKRMLNSIIENLDDGEWLDIYQVDWLKSLKDRVYPQSEQEWSEEDEKMRNAAINACKYMVDNFENSTKQYEDAIAWLEKRGEQKSDKVEPKFNVGDWCIDNEDSTIFQIAKVLDNTYTYKTNEGKEYSCSHYSLEIGARLWTIEDAKPGDILSNGTVILIFKKYIKGSVFMYCYHSSLGTRFGTSPTAEVASKYLHPATKGECEILLRIITEQGYEWNKDKLELTKMY